MRKSSRNSGSKGDNKRSRPTRRSSSVLGPRIVLEWLEERILLSEDLLYSAVDNRPLTLRDRRLDSGGTDGRSVDGAGVAADLAGEFGAGD